MEIHVPTMYTLKEKLKNNEIIHLSRRLITCRCVIHIAQEKKRFFFPSIFSIELITQMGKNYMYIIYILKSVDLFSLLNE